MPFVLLTSGSGEHLAHDAAENRLHLSEAAGCHRCGGGVGDAGGGEQGWQVAGAWAFGKCEGPREMEKL